MVVKAKPIYGKLDDGDRKATKTQTEKLICSCWSLKLSISSVIDLLLFPGQHLSVAVVMETEEQARNRFQSELEFVQCLANPNYLNFLAQRGVLRERPFINYLKYLLYWKEPEYAKFLKYPHCLHMLELLQYEHFRKELVNAQCAKFIDEQQLLHWQHYSRKRTRLQQALAEQQQPQQQPPPHGNATTK